MSENYYSEKLVTARKPHACHLCRKPISAGDRYVRVNMCATGDRSSTAAHCECHRVVVPDSPALKSA